MAYFEPHQLVVSRGGAAKLVFSVRCMSETRRDFVVVKMDLKNAFNAVARAAIIESLQAEPSLKHLSWLAAVVLAPVTGLESLGEKWGDCEEGGTQGDPLTGFLFGVAIQPYVRELDAALTGVGGMARFGCDDGYALGPPDIVFPALERFATSLREKCLLQWERSKTEVFLWDGPLLDSTSDGCQGVADGRGSGG